MHKFIFYNQILWKKIKVRGLEPGLFSQILNYENMHFPVLV